MREGGETKGKYLLLLESFRKRHFNCLAMGGAFSRNESLSSPGKSGGRTRICMHSTEHCPVPCFPLCISENLSSNTSPTTPNSQPPAPHSCGSSLREKKKKKDKNVTSLGWPLLQLRWPLLCLLSQIDHYCSLDVGLLKSSEQQELGDTSLWLTDFTVPMEYSVNLYFFHSFFCYIFHAAAQGKIRLCKPHVIYPHDKLAKRVY